MYYKFTNNHITYCEFMSMLIRLLGMTVQMKSGGDSVTILVPCCNCTVMVH